LDSTGKVVSIEKPPTLRSSAVILASSDTM
jgi:hypothetical protein